MSQPNQIVMTFDLPQFDAPVLISGGTVWVTASPPVVVVSVAAPVYQVTVDE